MKTSENQNSPSKEQESSDAQAAHSSSGEQQFKKPHPKLLNQLMKPSLSLTSLPPQSPKEVSDDAQSVERPYNSLKKKRDGEKELWRRSWESQASISTTTSHTGTSGGKNGNDFWAAYNFIMDTNLIDSCREATGETNKAGNDITGEFKAFKNNGDQLAHFNPSLSKGSSADDPRRLRRWLREMEAKVSKMPSITEAMKLNSNELKKFSLESADLYREIVAHGRAVAACIRYLEKENVSRTDDQPKSLDSVEHDSLDTIATTTSVDSKRGENVLKALERRYHLLYLRAIEIQCMFEGLLDRRSYLQSVEEFRPTPIDTSDEEPVAKVPKFGSDNDFTSCKPRDASKVVTESDADSEGSEGEMECAANGEDCVDGTMIVPIKQVTPPKTPSPNGSFETPQGTVMKRIRPKDFSKFHRSNRKSKNCAIFYYKHVDTDTDQLNDESGAEKPLVSSEASEEEVWEFTDTSHDVSPLTPDKEGNIIDELDCFPLELSPINGNSQQQLQVGIASNTTKLINSKESLRELVLEAESLVRQKINNQTSKTEYFFNEIIAKSKQQQRRKKMMEKSQKDTVKISRVQEWLKRHQESDAAIISQPSPATDCEASNEYTSDESGHESESSEEITDSIATCLQGVDLMQTSTEGLGSGVESVPMNKVTMRTKSSSRRHSERPWSVSCLSQLTRDSRQSLIDDAKLVETSSSLANFSISESALHNLSPQQYKNTSESDSKNCNRNAPSTVNSVGSKNSLRRRRAKLRKKSHSSNNKSESVSEMPTGDVSRNILRSMTKSESFSMGTTLMEDLSVAISMMTIVKDNQTSSPQPQKPESEDEQMMKPDFKIGSLTNVYATPSATHLGSLAALANYNHENNEQDMNETGTENMSSFSEQMWDNYMEKYNSEAYSEDRDVDAARRLLEFGDDYRNFIDSQSDCCSSLSAANIDSLSPPRHRKNLNGVAQNTSLSSNDNSMKILRQRRIQELPEMERRRLSMNGEDRKSVILEKLRQKTQEAETVARRRSFQSGSRPQSYKSSSSDHSDNELSSKDILKILTECKLNLERTEALRMANAQLLHPEDYEEIAESCRKNIESLEALLRAESGDPNTLKDLIISWNNLLNWSENAAVARRLQEEIISQKHLLESIVVDNGDCLNTEEAIREKIQELIMAREDLHKHRSNMLKLNASVHSWLTRQEMQRNADSKVDEFGNERMTQSDIQSFADDELHKHLKDEIVSLYAKWDSVNSRISKRIECLSTSLVCWKQFENGLFEFQENLVKDRGALFGLKGAIEDGTAAEDLVDNVQQVSKLLSEKLENKIQQTISTKDEMLLHPETALQFIASSNGSLSDSGISDGGFSELSERERRLNALKKIAKQLESALSPSSEVLKTITQRMEAAENELKNLQDTCRELIVRTSNQLLKQQGIDIPPITNANSQINVQIPIITIKGKSSKRSLPRRTKRKSPNSPVTRRATAVTGAKQLQFDSVGSKSDSELDELDEKETSSWAFVKRIAKMAVPVQLAIVALFCVACLLEPRCCDTLNNLSMSLTPQLRYVKGPPPT